MPTTPVVDRAQAPRPSRQRAAITAPPARPPGLARPDVLDAPAAPARPARAPRSTRADRAAAPGRPAAPARTARIREPEQHSFSGSVTLTAGPFEDLQQLGEFRRALSAIHGVKDVTVRTFQGRKVIFELDIAEPTVLIAALRARSARIPHLLHASDDIVRVSLT
jgi:hypothetical protein